MNTKSTEVLGRDFDLLEFLKKMAGNYNTAKGNLNEKDNINCSRCENRGGYIEIRMIDIDEELQPYEFFVECECMANRNIAVKAEESGLKELLKHSFDNFVAKTAIQKEMKKSAKKNAGDRKKWFYIGGMTGSGKSHICSAICKEMLNKRRQVNYAIWTEDFKELNFLQNDRKEFNWKMQNLKNVEILYIDDLFKVKKGEQVTNTDVQIAFSVINHRYNNDMKTIISSELTLEELVSIDEAVAGRIAEKAGEFVLNVDKNPDANYRFRNV